MQSSLQGWRMSALAAWSHFLAHEWWWIWRILEDKPRDLWCISHTPDRNNSTSLPYLLVAGCKPSRGAGWQRLWSSTKASDAPPYISSHNHWCLKLPTLFCWNMWARPSVQKIRSTTGIQQQIHRTDNLSYAPIPVSNFLWCCGKKSTSNMMYFSEPQCLKLGQCS